MIAEADDELTLVEQPGGLMFSAVCHCAAVPAVPPRTGSRRMGREVGRGRNFRSYRSLLWIPITSDYQPDESSYSLTRYAA